VGFGQTRTATRLPVLVMVTGYARWLSARLIPSRVAEDLFAGWWQLLAGLGAVPRVLVWDGEGAVGQRRRRQTVLTEQAHMFCGVLGAKIVICEPGDPEAKGLVERANGYLETSFLPGRSFASPADFNAQLTAWLVLVNQRHRRVLGCAPADRIDADRAAMLPLPPVAPVTRKSLEEFDYDHARSLKRETIAHLGTLDFVVAKENVVFLGPPGTGKTHLAIGLGIRACQAGHRVAFATAAGWVARLADAHNQGRLQPELVRLGRYPLLVIDEVGYIPFEAEAANLFFQLVSARYERASLIVTSNKPFGRWGEVFGDDVVAAAMIDRLVHHAEVVALKGDSYRLKDRDLGRVPTATTDEQ
jgi:DNA replication protein DnaC